MFSYNYYDTSVAIVLFLLEIYLYVGMLNGWWFSSMHLTQALKHNEVKNTKIHWITGVMFTIAWPLIIWKNNEESANVIARELKQKS